MAVTTMKTILKAMLCVCLMATNFDAALGGQVELSKIIMQLRSEVKSDNSILLSEILSTTTSFLDQYFTAYYSTDRDGSVFSHSALSVDSFGIHGLDGSFITTLEFDGLLFFNSDTKPTEDFINDLLVNAFRGSNQQIYVDMILENSKSPFMESLTHIIIEVDQQQVTKTGEDEVSKSGKKSGDGDGDESDKFWKDEETVRLIMYVGAILGGGTLCIFFMFLARYLYLGDDYDDQDDNEDYDVERNIMPKSLELAPTRSESSGEGSPRMHSAKPTAAAASKNAARNKPSAYRVNRINPHNIRTSLFKQNARRNQNPAAGAPVRSSNRGPTPSQSFMSHDTSLYTSNPVQVADTSKASASFVSVSNLHLDLPSIDLGVDNSKRNDLISPITPAPFGTDISAIEQTGNSGYAHEDLSGRFRHPYGTRTIGSSSSGFSGRPSAKSATSFSWKGRRVADNGDEFSIQSDGTSMVDDFTAFSGHTSKLGGSTK